MKWLYGCVVLLALGLLYFRPLLRHRKSDVVTVWTLSKSSASFDSYRYRNCSVSTCLRSQRCMLDYGKISVYIQPITRVVDDVGNVLSPVPSKEFHTIRKLLLHYSVSDPQQACIFFPGIDFLNLHRFPSIDVAHAVANMINERFCNVLMFTLIGEWKHNHRHIMASPIIPLHLYRHRLDISLSPYFGNLPAPTTSASSTHNTLLVMLFNASSSFREVAAEAFGRSTEVKILTECIDQPHIVCDASNNIAQWEKDVQESKFVLIHERMPHFKLALYRALEAAVIPVIFVPNHVLPFSDYIDWHLISLRLSGLARVCDIIRSLSDTKIENMRAQIRKIRSTFSSLEGIVNMTIRVLESRMLPTKARSYEHWNMMPERSISLPHLAPPVQLLLLVWSDSANAVYAQQDLRQLTSSQVISSAIVIWRNDDNAPSSDGWETSIPVEIITGIEHVRDILSIVKRKKNDVLLIIPAGRCGLDGKTLRKVVNIWRTVPDRRVVIRCNESPLLSATVIHKMLFSSALSTTQARTGFKQMYESLDVHHSLHVISREQANVQWLPQRSLPNNFLTFTCLL